jgi:hypothetical protein
VPRVLPIRRPERGYQVFRIALGEASGETVEPYDCRRGYATWLEAAGIPRTRWRLYLGHGATTVTDLYERHQVDAFLAEDAERLRLVLAPAMGSTQKKTYGLPSPNRAQCWGVGPTIHTEAKANS